MHIKHLNLINFRNYDSVDLKLEPGINLITGHNGAGKTSLVEAIVYASTLTAPRHGTYIPMIKMGQSQSIVRALARFAEKENLIEIELNRENKNKSRVNRSELSRPRDVVGYINTVCFTPDDARIVHDDPSDRRDFIDQLLIQFTPRLAGVFSDYERVLKQRNSLLKTSRNLPKDSPGLSTLEAWDESLVKLGSEIIHERIELVRNLNPHLVKCYKTISLDHRVASVSVVSSVIASDSDEDLVEVENLSRGEIEDLFRQRLLMLRPKELERGLTLVGPQRDDLKLMLGDFPAKGFISYGEAWSFAISLKLASAILLREQARAGDPILILDDVFSSLDDSRLARLLDMVSDYEQVIITDAIRGAQPVFEIANRIHIDSGKVIEQS